MLVLQEDLGMLIWDSMENERLMMQFADILRWLRKKETLLDAILFLDETLRLKFQWISLRMILSPVIHSNGGIGENPIAQVLADCVDMMRKRFGEPGYEKTESDLKQERKIKRLLTLLPITLGALKVIPQEFHVFNEETMVPFLWKETHVLSDKQIQWLPRRVFWNTLSVRVNQLPNIGHMAFLSNEAGYYQEDEWILLLSYFLENVEAYLQFIGKIENNEKDPLTGLLLRRGFNERVLPSSLEAISKWERLSFVFLDADHFKRVNDTYGHDMGDLVLKELGMSLRMCLKEQDITVRWWWEEFCALMRTEWDMAVKAMKRVSEHFSSKYFRNENGRPVVCKKWEDGAFNVTIIIGIASKANSLDEYIAQADANVYKAKKDFGRNCIVLDGVKIG